MTASDFWSQILKDLQAQINHQSFSTWFSNSEAVYFDGSSLTIKVHDDTAKRHISSMYTSMILASAEKHAGNSISVSFTLGNESAAQTKETETKTIHPKHELSQGFTFNPKYTFDSFVIGPNNQLAYAAALSISKAPAKLYNPFFLYGESGLGKTHLLQAIGNEIKKEKPYLNVLYISSEQFISEFIQSIANKTQHSFKIKYRKVDVLLIDDIQNLKDKEETQSEFFYTFEDLKNNSKQIVISSDRPPKEIANLADRLRTRFEAGLQADIKAPNIETREAILRRKATEDSIVIEDEIINYLAKRIKSNIRKLESALTNLQAASQTFNVPITIELAKQHLKHLFDEEVNKTVTISDIMNKVALKYKVTVDSLQSKSRHAGIVQPRFVAMYLCRQMTSITMKEIGKEFGNRDHSTVINACGKVEKDLKNDENLRDLINEITSDLKS
jgi:chromosomal replication initiator protein